MLEDFTDKSQHILIQFEQLMGPLRRKDVAGDINGAKAMLIQHSQLKESINSAAVESLMQDAHDIMKRLDHARSLNRSLPGLLFDLNLGHLEQCTWLASQLLMMRICLE